MKVTFEVYYAPFEAVNPNAGIVIVGITLGLKRASALKSAQADQKLGCFDSDAFFTGALGTAGSRVYEMSLLISPITSVSTCQHAPRAVTIFCFMFLTTTAFIEYSWNISKAQSITEPRWMHPRTDLVVQLRHLLNHQ